MLPHFNGTQADPITGREISNLCWNGHHEPDGLMETDTGCKHLDCETEGCHCMCHDHRLGSDGTMDWDDGDDDLDT